MDRNLVLIQRNNFNLKITFPYSIEGKTIYVTAKSLVDKRSDNEDAIIDLSLFQVGEDASNGIFIFSLNPEQTGWDSIKQKEKMPVGTYRFQIELWEGTNRLAFKLQNLSVISNDNKI